MRIATGQRVDRTTLSATILSRLTEMLDGIEQSRDDYYGADAYMQWGFKLTAGLQYAIDNRLPYIIIDWGYFSNRETCISVSFNGFHGLSMPVKKIRRKKARWHPEPKPWRSASEEESFVYVFGQLQNDRAVRGLHVDAWIRKTAVDAAKAFEMTAKIRPHPKMISSWERPLPALEHVLEECAVAVTYTSSVSILTVLAGIPTVALHPASPAADVSCTGYDIVRPERYPWLHDLSWRNYDGTELSAAADYIRIGLAEAVVCASAGNIDTVGLRV